MHSSSLERGVGVKVGEADVETDEREYIERGLTAGMETSSQSLISESSLRGAEADFWIDSAAALAFLKKAGHDDEDCRNCVVLANKPSAALQGLHCQSLHPRSPPLGNDWQAAAFFMTCLRARTKGS